VHYCKKLLLLLLLLGVLKNFRWTKLPKLLKTLECHSISLIRYIISLSLSLRLKAEGKKKPHAKNHPKTQSLQKQKIK